MTLGVRHNHSTTVFVHLVSADPKIPHNLWPRVIHYISSGGHSAADSREAVRALCSAILVCREWALVARQYLQEAAFSRVWSQAVRHLDGISKRPELSWPPAVYPLLLAVRSMLCNLLPKVPASTSFSSITLITLGSWHRGRVAITSVDDLCRAIASLEPLQELELLYLAWADSGLGGDHSRLPVSSHSRARPHELSVWAEQNWLLDIRSAHFITWLAQSRTASKLAEIHFEWMMILEERLLAAVAAVIDASKGSLNALVLSIGPALAMYSLAQPLSQCTSVYQLVIHLPYHITAFCHLVEFLTMLHPRQLKHLDLQFHSHPSCIEPSTAVWERLDTALQTPWHHLERVAVLEMGVNTGTHAITWGDVYPDSPHDPVACRQKVADRLPLTHRRRVLFSWDDPYSLPVRVPGRVKPFLPVKIAERIIDFVAGTGFRNISVIRAEGVPATLASCSLTCQDWRPRAQAHLFRVVTLSSTRYERRNITGLQSHLANHPALSSYIRTCTVHDTPSPPAKSPSIHNAPFQLLGMLPQLKHLRLSAGTFYPPPGIAFDACMRRLSSIVSLWIHGVTFYSVNDLRRMISACRNVKTLRLMDCAWRGKPKPIASELRMLTSVRLTEFIVTGNREWIMDPRSANFLQWLARSGALVSAKGIRLPRFIAGAGDMLAASQSLIHACRSTLTTLRLLLSPEIDYSCLSNTLSGCAKLHALALFLPFDTSLTSRLVHFLATEALDTRSRRELDLYLVFEIYPGCTAPTVDDWRNLDDVLQTPAYEFLGHVTVMQISLAVPEQSQIVWGDHYDFKMSDHVLKDELRTLLPRAYRRRLLRYGLGSQATIYHTQQGGHRSRARLITWHGT